MSQLDIRSLSFSKTTAAPLGFAIRGGFEHGTSVFVSNVTAGSPADVAGLRIGDEILEVNGFSLASSTQDETVLLIRSMKRLSLQVKNRDLLPRKDNANDPVSWYYVEKAERKKFESSPAVSHSILPVSASKTRSIPPLKDNDVHELRISDVDDQLSAKRFSNPGRTKQLEDEEDTRKDADKLITIV